MESDFEMSVREFLAREPFCFRNVPDDALFLFCAALTHDSYTNEALQRDPPERAESYERLEFLGDAVLEFLVCEHVFRETAIIEGPMTDYKQDKVCNGNISQRILDKGIQIDSLMRVGKGQKQIEEKMRADCFEALVAATYLSYGLDAARDLVHRVLL